MTPPAAPIRLGRATAPGSVAEIRSRRSVASITVTAVAVLLARVSVAENKNAAEPRLPEDKFAASGAIELLFYDETPTAGAPQRPTFKVSTPRTTLVEGGKVSFREAEAVIYGPDGAETRLRAARGEFDNASKRALLQGGVALESGTLRVLLEDVAWINKDRAARSQNPVQIVDGPTEVRADTFEFFPQGEVLNLTNVVGAVVLKERPAEPMEESAPTPDNLFTKMVVNRAPEVRMAMRRFEFVRGGVELAFHSEDSQDQKVGVAADEALFFYDTGKTLLPERVNLKGHVQLDGPAGRIACGMATIYLASRRFECAGDVHGSSPDLEAFRAQTLLYEPGLLRLAGGVALVTQEGTVRAQEAEFQEASQTMTLAGQVSGQLAALEDFHASRIVHHLDTADAEISDLQARGMQVGVAAAQGGTGGAPGFSSMTIHKAPRVRVAANRIKTAEGGIDIALQPPDSKTEPTRIRAGRAEFAYHGQDPMPETVRLEGNVVVEGMMGKISSRFAEMTPKERRFVFTGEVMGSTPDIESFKADRLLYDEQHVVLEGRVDVAHPRGTFQADRAELDNATGKMEFSGQVRGDSPQVQGLTAERATYDPATGAIELHSGSISQWTPEGLGPLAGDPLMLRESDVRDWPGLLKKIKEQAASDAPSPGRRILALLPQQVSQGLRSLPADKAPNAGAQQRITKEINKVLTRRDLYEEEAWKGIRFDQTTRDLLARDRAKLSDEEVLLLNRALLDAAYPEEIAQRAPDAAQSG